LVRVVLDILLEDVDLDRRDDLEEIGIPGNCFTSNLVLELVPGRRREWRSG
jgi:hypothetical protein